MSRDKMSNIQRISAVLKSFDAQNNPRSSQALLDGLGMSRTTGFGLLRAMVQRGWLERADHGLVRLGPRALDLAFAPLEAPVDTRPTKLAPEPRRGQRVDIPDDAELEWDPSLTQVVDTQGFARPGPWRIGFANASESNPWRRAMLQSLSYAHRIAQSQIADLIVMDAQDDSDLQLRQIDELVAAGVDLLLISIVSVVDSRISDRLKDLAQGGLPIVAVDRRPNDRSSLVSFVTASDHRIGRISAQWLAEHLGGQGRVWLLSGLDGASPALRRQRAALAVFSDFPGISVESVSYTDWTEAGGYAAIDRLLPQSGGAPDGVWCDSGLQGVGSLRRFLEAGVKPAHTGGDLNEMYKLCLHHKVPMVALDYPASMGARALQLALDVLSGTRVPQRLEVPVQVVLPRGYETRSVKADLWAERHVAWELDGSAVLSQGPALRSGPAAPARARASG